ncbi:MAG: tRNA methyltransferase, partial [Nanoarchaeota archaeon]|nr:tRNA methyltransferase [Nanoarchaeota archaeon]
EGKEYNSEVKKCLRIWPQDNDSEGFFVAKIRKV